MTPAERILELYPACYEEALKLLQKQLTADGFTPTLDQVRMWLDEPERGQLKSGFAAGANIGAIVQYLNEERERQRAFEAAVLERLGALDGKRP